jgi:3-oxoacid CoA-transferase B subunit
MYANLGIGLPTLVSQFIPEGTEVIFHSENGVLGYGGITTESSEMDIDLVNAGLQPVTLRPGASFFNHADSFAMIRGGHIDLAILGGYQVSEKGDLANWTTSHERVGAVGGAMDLACGVRRVIIIMQHVTASGEPRIVTRCTYPLTASEVVNTIITDLAVIEVTEEGLMIKEIAPGWTLEEVQAATEPELIVASDLKEIELWVSSTKLRIKNGTRPPSQKVPCKKKVGSVGFEPMTNRLLGFKSGIREVYQICLTPFCLPLIELPQTWHEG